MTRDKSVVPALMFHSVGLQDLPWAWSYISEPLETFESKVALLKDRGFTGIFWADLYEYMAGRRSLPENSILLTFDDGYLDNWVYVFPILKKYGMKGTIFVSPDFVDPLEEVRPNLDDVQSGHCSSDELSVAGFLNWPEMRAMQATGLVDIQSHAMTHTWYFSGPRILDFHRPHAISPLPWLFWNARRDRKPYYLTENQQEFLPWGYPILEHQKSLAATRYFPADEAVNRITDFVAEQGGRDFLSREDWRAALKKYLSVAFGGDSLPGAIESEDAKEARIRDELARSKKSIEDNLGKPVDFICWPGGANSESVQEIARSVGYKSWTLDSRSQLNKRNMSGTDPTSIKRLGTSNQVVVKGKSCGEGGPRLFIWKILSHQGSAIHRAAAKAYKLWAFMSSFVRKK